MAQSTTNGTAGPGILTAAELDSIRRPLRGARLLPGRAYHDEAIHE